MAVSCISIEGLVLFYIKLYFEGSYIAKGAVTLYRELYCKGGESGEPARSRAAFAAAVTKSGILIFFCKYIQTVQVNKALPKG